MTELIEVTPKAVPIAVRCDCKFKTVKGERIKKPAQDQPLVYLYPGIDPNYVAGSCGNCKKQIIERVTPKPKKEKKNVKAKKN